MTPTIIISSLSLLLGAIVFVVGIVQRRMSAQTHILTALVGRVTNLETGLADRVGRLETKVEVFWRGVSFSAAQILHSPHEEFARRDELLEKFMEESLSLDEASKLLNMLQEVVQDEEVNGAERLAASTVLGYLRFWLEDRGIAI